MRYNILGFDQTKAFEYGLSIDELMVLRHMHDFASSGKMETVIKDGVAYYWIKYDKFIDDLPILNMKKTRLMEIFNNNLCEKPIDWIDRVEAMSESTKKRARSYKFIGVLKSFTRKDKTGTYSYFAFTKKFYDMIPSVTSNDSDNKKASNGGTKEAETHENKNICTNSISNKDEKYTNELKKNLNPKIHKGLPTDFFKYGADELEQKLMNMQKDKENDKEKCNNESMRTENIDDKNKRLMEQERIFVPKYKL